mmetsp:Transcript_57645/g.153558  ORF Transcript_57645/g.153558 Transcript_57645/m.153558 type:complete len:248 (+) Transcript_57645:760-1503(+)
MLRSFVGVTFTPPERGGGLRPRSSEKHQVVDGIFVDAETLHEQLRPREVLQCSRDIATASRQTSQQPEPDRGNYFWRQGMPLIGLHLCQCQEVPVHLTTYHSLCCLQSSFSVWKTVHISHNGIRPADVKLQLSVITKLLEELRRTILTTHFEISIRFDEEFKSLLWPVFHELTSPGVRGNSCHQRLSCSRWDGHKTTRRRVSQFEVTETLCCKLLRSLRDLRHRDAFGLKCNVGLSNLAHGGGRGLD